MGINKLVLFNVMIATLSIFGCKRDRFESFYEEYTSINNREDRVDFLSHGLKSRDPNIQRFSILSLGELRAIETEESVIYYLKSVDPDLQKAAIWALIDMKSVNAYPYIVNELESVTEDIRWLSLKYFGELKISRSIPYLEHYAKAGTVKEKCQAILSIGKVSPNYAVELFKKLDPKDRRIRYCILDACRQIDTERSTELIRSFLTDPRIKKEVELILSERASPR